MEVEKKSGMATIIFYSVLGILVIAAVAYLARTKGAPDDSVTASSKSWSSPQLDLEQVWSHCHAACDASRDFTEKYLVSSSKEG